MISEPVERAYYAVIPAQVRYDRALKPNAKLLYGELTALCNQTGYCWASNDYFAQLYGLTAETISRLIAQLEQRGYIRCEMEATDKGSRRRIYAGCFLVEPGGVDKNVKTPLDEKIKDPLDKKVKQNITSNNNTIPPKAPQGGRRGKYQLTEEARAMLNAYVAGDRALAEAMSAFMEMRTAKRAVNSARAIRLLLADLERMSNGEREVKLALLRQSTVNAWKGIFPLRGSQPGPESPSRVLENEKVPSW